MLTGMKIMFQVPLFFNIKKTQGHTMNLSDLRSVKLHNDNLMMINHAWEQTVLAHGNDSDQHGWEKLV